jgi:Tol biopolymer transport system component
MSKKARRRSPEILVKDRKPRVISGKIFLGLFVALLVLWASSPATSAAGGSLLAFVRGDNFWIANSDGTEARQLTSDGQAASPALSRDGQWVAFTSSEGNKSTINLASTGGGLVKGIKIPGIYESWSPAFTPDGGKLVVVSRFNVTKRQVEGETQEYATHAVSLVDLNTGTVRHVVKTPNHFIDGGNIYDALAVSPDGRLIAYQESGTDVSGGFVVLNLEGKRVVRFPKDPQDYHPYWRPTFSPDGRQVLCFSMAITEGAKTFIYLVDLKTLKAARVAEGYYPTFVDGGKAIVFERWTETGRTGKEATKIDLWRQDLTPGSEPRLMLENAEKPAGQG